jgi:hypothetical protein
MTDDVRPQGDRFLDVHRQLEWLVLTILQLDDTRDADKINPLAELEISDDGSARQDQDAHARVVLDQGMRDRTTAAQMSKAECIVAVNQDSPVAGRHASLLCQGAFWADYGTSLTSAETH